MTNLADYLLGTDVPDDHILSYFDNETYTIGEYRDVIKELTGTLEAAGIPSNTSALLIFDDTPLAIALFLACMKYGIVPILASTFTMDSVVDRVIDTADLTMVFSDGSRDFSSFDKRVILGSLSGSMRPGKAVLSFDNNPASIEARFVDADEIAFFLMTSGSTGIPKIVKHSHHGMAFTTRVYAKETLGITDEDRIYSIAKTSFGYGLANNVFFPFSTGAAAYIDSDQFEVTSFFRKLETIKPTVLFGIPTAFSMMLNYISEHPEEKAKLSSIRNYISAGETLREDIALYWKELTGVFIKDNMGSSEASAILINEGNELKYGSAGKPVKDSEVRLIGANGEDSNTGSLHFKSEGNAIGYYNNPEEEALHYRDGYLTTGDVFTIDEDGYYWYVGREDNLMKYHGFWVFPQGIEKTICEFEGVRQAVVTKATVKGVDILAAALVIGPEFAGTDELTAFLEERLEMFKRPKKYLILDEFPLNERGKINLGLIKKTAETDD